MRLPYEKWNWGDTGWLVLIAGLAAINIHGARVTSEDSFILGIFAAAAAFGWWKYRERRKEHYWAEHDRMRRHERGDPL